MKKSFTVVSACILVVLLAGCNQENNNHSSNDGISSSSSKTSNIIENNKNNDSVQKEPVPQSSLQIEDYYPIKKNTHYVYQGMGNEYASYDVYIDYSTATKVQQRIDNGGTVTANIVEIKDGKLTKLYTRPEAYYRENLLKFKNEEEILLMEPLKKGTSWNLTDSRKRTITGISVPITTPSGNYKAIEVTTEGKNDKSIDYYAKNVGLVKSVFATGESDETKISSSLSKIEINKPFVQTVNFYYPNINTGKIYYQSQNLRFHTNDLTKKVLESAYKKSVNNQLGKVFSKNTKVNSIYLNKDQNVYIDLNKAFVSEMNAGSAYEAMILQCMVNTFGQYYNAQKVYVTIDNHSYESGHIALKKGEFLNVKVNDSIEIQK